MGSCFDQKTQCHFTASWSHCCLNLIYFIFCFALSCLHCNKIYWQCLDPWTVDCFINAISTDCFVFMYDIAVTLDQFPAAAQDCLIVSVKGCRGCRHFQINSLLLFAWWNLTSSKLWKAVARLKWKT